MATRSATFTSLFAGTCVGLLAFAAPVPAQDRMDKPVRILVGFAPGGTADLIARVVADKLKDTIGAHDGAVTAMVMASLTPITVPANSMPGTSYSLGYGLG